MSRWLMFALCVLLGSAGSLRAQRMTEQFIPIGRSPGVSGTNYSVIGTIEFVDTAGKMLRIAGSQGPVTLVFTDTTHIWIDRSAQRQAALVGSPADLVVGRRAEAKFVSYERREIAEWIKVAAAAGVDSELASRPRVPRIRAAER
ncbi:MAG: hypothetical protein ACREF4_06495 [Gammaproteobacteria bacterium]